MFKPLQSIVDLIMPNRCRISYIPIESDNSEVLSLKSSLDLPFANFYSDDFIQTKTNVMQLFPFENYFALLRFDKGNHTEKLLYKLKYASDEKIGKFLAQLAYQNLEDNLSTFDLLTSVPIHPIKQRKRGYNQVHLFTKTLAEKLGKDFNNHLIQRVKHSKSQTKRKFEERYRALENTFALNSKERLRGYKNILLIDDVTTTGSTLAHCAQAIKSEMNVKVSAFTLAYRGG